MSDESTPHVGVFSSVSFSACLVKSYNSSRREKLRDGGEINKNEKISEARLFESEAWFLLFDQISEKTYHALLVFFLLEQ